MTQFLLDRDVLSALENPQGHKNVHAWVQTVPDIDLFLSAVSVIEARKGLQREFKKAKTERAAMAIRGYQNDFDILLAGFAGRILPVDEAVARRWGDLLGQREANVMDVGVAATAFVHNLVVATRNLKHFRHRGVRVIDPFKAKPKIV